PPPHAPLFPYTTLFRSALGNATHDVYDRSFNLVQVIDAAGQLTARSYDQNGNLTQTTGPNGAITKFTYAGPFDRLTSYTDPNGRSEEHTSELQSLRHLV